MFLWIAAGYMLSAVIFYSFIAATAQEDPYQNEAALAETTDRPWISDQSQRKQSQRKAA